MAKNDWYTVFDRKDYYLVQKVDPDDHSPKTDLDNPGTLNAYKVSKISNSNKLSTCECWAGHKWCRHKKMIVEFQKLGRIDQRYLYNFDRNKWIEPLTWEEA